MRSISIYALVDSGFPDEVRYVGQTCNVTRRLYMHLRAARRRNRRSYVRSWIRHVLKQKRKVQMIVITSTPSQEHADLLEKYCIAAMSRAGERLTNVAEGGREWPVRRRS